MISLHGSSKMIISWSGLPAILGFAILGFAIFGFDLGGVWTPLLLFVGTFVGSLAVVGILLVKLPADYFNRDHHHDGPRHPVLYWTVLVLKNLIGVVLVVMGFLMLFLPGQGVLTILIGVMLLNFPGKRRLQRKLVSRPGVLKTINKLRSRFGQPPLVVDDEPQDEQRGDAEKGA
jgi:putative transmembrane protein PGPGW